MDDYRVKLNIYNGPMDLLLYLIGRDELDIHDIPIAEITAQYCQHVEVIKDIDPDMAGEFLVMAATLMEIKTRMLLPRPGEEGEGEEAFDPRADLVRQLLEYKAFKDAADDLRSAAADQALRFPRRPPEAETDDDGKDLDEVQLWDLVGAFNHLLKAIGHEPAMAEIVYDDTPIELHVTDILDRLRRDGDMTFAQIFAGREKRAELVGLFLALLELIRRQQAFVEQEKAFGEIYVFLNRNTPPAGGAETPSEVKGAEVPGAAQTGTYVSESHPPAEQDRDDDDPGEAAGAGA